MMYDFLDRLVNIALPRVKDFRGLVLSNLMGMGTSLWGLKSI